MLFIVSKFSSETQKLCRILIVIVDRYREFSDQCSQICSHIKRSHGNGYEIDTDRFLNFKRD